MILSSPTNNLRATPPYNANDSSSKTDDSDDSLEETARREEDYVRERLRGELGREPSDEELREWLREHTEGY
jgi:DNA-directed RNA polymerase specialized sigma subunit